MTLSSYRRRMGHDKVADFMAEEQETNLTLPPCYSFRNPFPSTWRHMAGNNFIKIDLSIDPDKTVHQSHGPETSESLLNMTQIPTLSNLVIFEEVEHLHTRRRSY